ncbi:hypothetical protein J5N97_027130 [Dioscorea zingiberensis]|uniref:ELMO domain-containing protein n=1 Tax=Dioscorea zingiberensis TaxID=325984 RepID=A0A9D5C3G3_9LILI|nr:hypothetical protein J5N97_027130 [Dioscorea zingiberensis]
MRGLFFGRGGSEVLYFGLLPSQNRQRPAHDPFHCYRLQPETAPVPRLCLVLGVLTLNPLAEKDASAWNRILISRPLLVQLNALYAINLMLWLVQDHGLEESFTALPISATVVVKIPLSLSLLLFRNKGCKGCRDGYTCLLMRPDQIIKKLSGPCGRLPFRTQIFQAWYLSSGKIWGGRGQIHQLTSEAVGLFHLRTFCFLLGLIRILFKQEGMRAAWEYPFAVAGINVSFMLIQMLDLYSAKPKSLPGVNFIKILSEDEAAFDVLYCIAFQMMDAQWLAMRASYLQFKVCILCSKFFQFVGGDNLNPTSILSVGLEMVDY